MWFVCAFAIVEFIPELKIRQSIEKTISKLNKVINYLIYSIETEIYEEEVALILLKIFKLARN